MGENALLKMKGISKAFPGVQALKAVDFVLHKGEVVSLIGQNGAGKSTLVSIIGGIYAHDDGEISIDGRKVNISNPAVAEDLGIGMVHQEPTLVPNMTVAANVFLNRELLKKGLFLNFRRMNEQTVSVLEQLGFHLDPEALVEDLRLVEKEVVEIAKAMLVKPRILILDEVTAPLNADEAEHLFSLVCELKSKGMAIIFISHRLTEVVQISDRIVILRDGLNVGEVLKEQDPSEKDIITLMLGQNAFETQVDTGSIGLNGDKVLSVVNLSKRNLFEEMNLELHAGEIVGMAGLKGAGITEFMKAIYGAQRIDAGRISVQGELVDIKKPADAINHGIGMLTNDRQKEGLALQRGVEENITISSLDGLCNKFKFFRTRILGIQAAKLINSLSIKTPSLRQEVLNLSGGNQQKVVLAKWLLRNLDFILIDEPTRGVDVKAKTDIYKLLLELKRSGKAILLFSPEVPELLRICDRILVVVSGKIINEVHRSSGSFNEGSILEMLHVDHLSPSCKTELEPTGALS
jgi:ABC-type sugar transport system ATPase subunit